MKAMACRSYVHMRMYRNLYNPYQNSCFRAFAVYMHGRESDDSSTIHMQVHCKCKFWAHLLYMEASTNSPLHTLSHS